MSFTATVGYEYPSKLGPPIAYTMRYDVTMQRPDKLKILMPGDGPASEFYYDGKAMMAYAPAEDLVAVAAAPPTIEEALKVAYNTAATRRTYTAQHFIAKVVMVILGKDPPAIGDGIFEAAADGPTASRLAEVGLDVGVI